MYKGKDDWRQLPFRKEQNAFYHMHWRCENSKFKQWKDYGGRGIKVCDRWSKNPSGFRNFLQDMGECPPDLTLDRIDNDGNYEPSNCKWATRHEQANNRRNNRKIEYEGKLMTYKECAAILGIHVKTLRGREKLGWTGDKLFSKGKTKTGKPLSKMVEYDGRLVSVEEFCKATGISMPTIYRKLNKGRTGEQMLSELDKNKR